MVVNGDLPTQVALRPPCDHAVLVRVHTRCTAGDVFAADCHCRETLDQSMRMIAEEGCGVVLYLHNTSRGFEIDRSLWRRLGRVVRRCQRMSRCRMRGGW